MDNKRRHSRVKAVLPVRVLGNDHAGDSYADLAHTLDITEAGARLGSVQRTLRVGDVVTVQYRQHKAEFRVVWIARLSHLKEHHVGLEAMVQKDVWGLGTEPRFRIQVAQPERASASV